MMAAASLLLLVSLLPGDSRNLIPWRDYLPFHGTWELVSAERSGQFLGTDHNKITIDGATWTAGEHEYRYVLYPNRHPKQIDWIANDEVWRGIYDLAEGRMTLCFSRPGNLRPSEFATTKGDGWSLHVRRLLKPPEEEEKQPVDAPKPE